MKQVVLSMVIVLLAAGLFAAMVLYTLWMIRAAQLQILLGELCVLGSNFLH